MNDKLLSFLGLARRAGRLSLGFDAAVGALEDGRSQLILTASDLSPRSRTGIACTAQELGVAVLELRQSMDEISMALGKRTGIVSIDDAGFAKKTRTLMTEDREESAI